MSLLTKAKVITTPTAYSDGFLHSVKPNVLENLLLQSNTFDTTWIQTGTITSGQSGYDGTNNAWKWENPTSTSSIFQLNTNSGIQTISAYFKKNATYGVRFFVFGSSNANTYFDLNNGVVVAQNNTIDASVEPVGTDWFRCSMTINQTNSRCDFYVTNNAQSQVLGHIIIQDAQLNKGLTADQYIETTTETSPRADFTFTRNSSATRVGEDGYIQDVQIIGGELVQNGDFEEIGSELVSGDNANFNNSTGDWQQFRGVLSWDSYLQAGKWTDNNTLGGPVGFTMSGGVIPTLANKIYIIEFRAKTDSNNSFNFSYIGVSSTFNTISNPNLTSDFQDYKFTFVTSAVNQRLYVGFSVSPLDNGESYFIDNVSVKEVGQNWVFGTGWSMGDGKAVYDDTANGDIRSQAFFLTATKKYRIKLSVSDLTSGTAFFALGSASSSNLVGYDYYANGDYTFEVISPTNGELRIYATTTSSGSFSIDNISVKEITDDTNLPRINYEGFSYENGLPIYGSGKGHFLLEGQSTNLVPYSQTLGNNTSSGGISFTYNDSISPDGTLNAALVSVTASGDRLQPSFVAVNGLVAISIFVKHNGTDFTTQLNTYNSGDATLYGAVASVTATGVTFTSYSSGFDSANFVDYGNGWFRLIVVCQSTTGNTFAQWRPTSVNATISYPCFGFQCEVGSYATSYIPTNGSAVTRAAETCNNAGNADLFDSEGVLYAEIAALANDGTYREIALSDGTTSNRIEIRYTPTDNLFQYVVRDGGIVQLAPVYLLDNALEFNKIAFRYKDNDFSLWINGVQVDTDTSGTAPAGLSKLAFDDGNGANDFYGKTKMVAVFPYLSNDEMECLTGEGYGSFGAMALANNYTIIQG